MRLRTDLMNALGASSEKDEEEKVPYGRRLSDESQKSGRSSLFGYMKDKVTNLIGSARGTTTATNNVLADEPASRSSMNGNPFAYRPGES